MEKIRIVHMKLPEELASELEKIGRMKGNCLSAEIRQRLHASLQLEKSKSQVGPTL